MKQENAASGSFADRYPNVGWWVANQGWIEVGYDDFNRSFARALDIGGMVWEGEPSYPFLEDAFLALDAGIRVYMTEMGMS